MAAVAKLNLRGSSEILAKLNTRQDSFKEKAGFSNSKPRSIQLKDLYKDFLAVNGIQRWVDDESPSLEPTWKNFLLILREPTMDLTDVADEIETYLKSTAQKVLKHPKQRESKL